MRNLIVIAVILTLNACTLFKANGIEVRIKNVSSAPIAKVELTTSEKLDVVKFDQIKAGESIRNFLSMRKNKSDGSYLLTFTRATGKKEIFTTGYYTNGGPLDSRVDFIVKSDTTIVKFKESTY